MGYNTDWDNLISGALGGARQRSEEAKHATDALDDLQTQMDAQMKKRTEQLRRMSSQLTGQLKQDGLLDDLPAAQTAAPAARQAGETRPGFGSWDGVAEELGKTLLGQETFLKALTRAFRRPTVLGVTGEGCRNVILISGGEGSGRHAALDEIATELCARGLLSSGAVARMDLALYPGPSQEKLFLQDLYGALNAPGDIVAFDHYENCAPGYLQMLSDLCTQGKMNLASRYVLQKGILVDAGTALVNGAVSAFTPKTKFFIFFSTKGPEKLMDKFGAPFLDAMGDICTTDAYTPEALTAIAARELNRLAQKAKKQLGFTLEAGADVRDWLSGQYCKAAGVEAITGAGQRIFKALAQYKLEHDDSVAALPVKLAVDAAEGGLTIAFGEEAPLGLAALLPAAYTGERADAEKQLDELIGLDEVKEYVRALADNVQAQRRRRAAGLPTASVTMHTIFAGNPGTGKTTVARILSKYLKAIGALRGGQLVEVSRADLVGRYVGHTAPLTNQVIQSALGGVLFIDEAYSLYRGNDDAFSLEAIDTLVKGMEDHRDDLVVILAGYSREMAVFLTANSGLASRFPNQIEFPDYTGEQLLQILQLTAKGKGYKLEDACALPLKAYFDAKQVEDAAKNGNGRMARNLLEKAILNQAKRMVASPDASMDTLLVEDFDLEK